MTTAKQKSIRRKMSSGEARKFFDDMYSRGERKREAAAEAHLKTPAGDAERRARNAARLKKNPSFSKRKIKRKHIQSQPHRTFTLIGRPSGPIFRLIKEYISKAGIKTVWGISADEKKQTVAREKDVIWK